jgi:ubiquinone/menaquinone biosynthesis C-methylase UbiE
VTEDLSLHAFTSIDGVGDLDTFVEALIAFDAIAELQELKEIERAMVAPGSHVLDVGCGFGLETVRLSQRVGPSPPVAGIDASAHFIDEARGRAAAARLAIDYRVGKAEALPYPDAAFDHVRAERLLIYLHDVRGAVAEMQRVLSPGGTLALIEPDFGTTTVNLPDRALVRRAVAHEADTAVAQSWLPGTLRSMLGDLGFRSVAVATRVVVFPQALGREYFDSVAMNAQKDGAISAEELAAWQAGIADLAHAGRLFGTIDYFLFTATR